jgi:hypothetical protein
MGLQLTKSKRHVNVYPLYVLQGLYSTTWAMDENREYFSIPNVLAPHPFSCNNPPPKKFLLSLLTDYHCDDWGLGPEFRLYGTMFNVVACILTRTASPL